MPGDGMTYLQGLQFFPGMRRVFIGQYEPWIWMDLWDFVWDEIFPCGLS